MQLTDIAIWGAAASTTSRALTAHSTTVKSSAVTTATATTRPPAAKITTTTTRPPVAKITTAPSLAKTSTTSTSYSVFFSSLDPSWYLDEASKLSIYTSILSQVTLGMLQDASRTAPGHPLPTLPVPIIPFYENSTTDAFNLFLDYPANQTLHMSTIAPCVRPSKLRSKAKRSDYAWCPVPELAGYPLIFRDDLPVLWQAWGPLEGVDLDARGPASFPWPFGPVTFNGEVIRPPDALRNPHYYGPIFDSVNRRKQLDSNMDFGVDEQGRIFHWETIVAPDPDGVLRDKPTWPSYEFLLCYTELDGLKLRVFITGQQIIADAPYADGAKYTDCKVVGARAGMWRACFGPSAQGCTISR